MIDWHGCYRGGWQNEIVPEAFSHPAKFARGLIRRIYEYALERGYLKEGDTVLDPFDGVALGALDAMFHGLHHIGCELEDKFVQLGQQNIDLWDRRYGKGLPRWGTAVILQGDSRRLVEVLEGARAEGIIASPPWGKKVAQAVNVPDMKTIRPFLPPANEVAQYLRSSRKAKGLSIRQVNKLLGTKAMYGWFEKPRLPSEVPTPILWRKLKSILGLDDRFDQGILTEKVVEATWKNTVGRNNLIGEGYGTDPAQLGNMPTGEPPQGIIGSPPYATQTVHDRCGVDPNKLAGNPPGPHSQVFTMAGYGQTDGQLAALPEGEPPAGIVSSPPFESVQGTGSGDLEARRGRTDTTGKYGQSIGQIGNTQGDTFWSAAKTIMEQCYQVLAPGGVAIWVLKAFVRNKAIVDFPGQWETLCNSCGFETVEIIRAWLIEDRGAQFALNGDLVKKRVARKSFFRRLHESKYPNLAIDYEVVLVTRKI